MRRIAPASQRRRAFAKADALRALVVDAGEQVLAPEHADTVRRAREPDLEAGVAREQDLVAGIDRLDVRPDRGHDRLTRLCAFVDRHDQAARGLGVVEGLDDDPVVQRFEHDIPRGVVSSTLEV